MLELVVYPAQVDVKKINEQVDVEKINGALAELSSPSVVLRLICSVQAPLNN